MEEMHGVIRWDETDRVAICHFYPTVIGDEGQPKVSGSLTCGAHGVKGEVEFDVAWNAFGNVVTLLREMGFEGKIKVTDTHEGVFESTDVVTWTYTNVNGQVVKGRLP